MTFRRAALGLTLTAVLALGACGAKDEPASPSGAASSSVVATTAASQAGAPASSAAGKAAPDLSGRKKAATAKLPTTVLDLKGKPTDDATTGVGIYNSGVDAKETKLIMVSLYKQDLMGVDPAAALEGAKQFGDANCGMIGGEAAACVVLLDGGHLMVNGGDKAMTPEKLSKYAEAIYASFA